MTGADVQGSNMLSESLSEHSVLMVMEHEYGRDKMGEEALNRALSKFIHDKRYQPPPYTTSAELLEYIRAEAGPQHDQLITDLFEKVLYLQRHHITTAAPTFTVVVDEAPYEAGFDPCNKLIDRVSEDNRKRISM